MASKDALVKDVGALIERLQSLAQVVKDRSDACKQDLASSSPERTTSPADSEGALPSATEKKLRMVSRALHGRLKDTMDALTQLKRIADDALVLSPEDDASGDRLRALGAELAMVVFCGGLDELAPVAVAAGCWRKCSPPPHACGVPEEEFAARW